MKNLTELSKEIYEGNKRRGFDAGKENVGQSLMLVVSELGEAIEAHRKGKFADMKSFNSRREEFGYHFPKEAFKETIKDSFEDEIADAVIRLLDLSAGLNIDIEEHIQLKLKYNETREYKHGKNY